MLYDRGQQSIVDTGNPLLKDRGEILCAGLASLVHSEFHASHLARSSRHKTVSKLCIRPDTRVIFSCLSPQFSMELMPEKCSTPRFYGGAWRETSIVSSKLLWRIRSHERQGNTPNRTNTYRSAWAPAPKVCLSGNFCNNFCVRSQKLGVVLILSNSLQCCFKSSRPPL